MDQDAESIIFAKKTLEINAKAIKALADRLGTEFSMALNMLDECLGKVIVTGVGKSGLAARKIAATFTSIGCPSVFLHPSEAMHGDLGLVQSDDLVIALSNSGESEELLAILPSLLIRETRIIAITGNLKSTLAERAAVTLDSSVEREICPLNLAPTTSVLSALALGDALAMSLQKRRNRSTEDYARNHPGGRLGRRLTLKVSDILPSDGSALPFTSPSASFQEVVCALTSGHMGAVCVLDDDQSLIGLIAESDFRQALLQHESDIFGMNASQIMNPTPILILDSNQLAFHALEKMTNRPRALSVAPVLDETGKCVGLLRINDLVKAGL